MLECVLLFMLLGQALIIWWGVRLAQRKGRDPLLGALLTFFFGLIGIGILYLLADHSAADHSFKEKETIWRD